jgi:hypothetical protein
MRVGYNHAAKMTTLLFYPAGAGLDMAHHEDSGSGYFSRHGHKGTMTLTKYAMNYIILQ